MERERITLSKDFFWFGKMSDIPLTLIATLPPEMKDSTQDIHLGENPFHLQCFKTKMATSLCHILS
jgi:hypothetical protein